MIRIRKPDDYARKNAKLGTSSNFYAVYQRKFEPNRKVMALTFGTGKNRTLSWLLEDDSGTPPPKPLYLEHELKGCAPSCCRPICGCWPEPCCFPGCCPGKGCLPGCFPCCGCGPDGRCCYGGDMCRHTCPTGGLVPLEDEDGKRIEDVRAAKYEDFKRVIAKHLPLSQTSIVPHLCHVQSCSGRILAAPSIHRDTSKSHDSGSRKTPPTLKCRRGAQPRSRGESPRSSRKSQRAIQRP
jgi:hypothetical protein